MLWTFSSTKILLHPVEARAVCIRYKSKAHAYGMSPVLEWGGLRLDSYRGLVGQHRASYAPP